MKKNNKLMVPYSLDSLKKTNHLVAQFPNSSSAQCFSNSELKRLFFFVMPLCWYTIFINTLQSLHYSTIEALGTYMVHQGNQMDSHRKKIRENNNYKNHNKNNHWKIHCNRETNSSDSHCNTGIRIHIPLIIHHETSR